MDGVTVWIGSEALAGTGTSARISTWNNVARAGWVVKVRGGFSYVSLAEVEVMGKESGEQWYLAYNNCVPIILQSYKCLFRFLKKFS